jgi:hypothetical protein
MASHYYKLAADQGNDNAQTNLALLYKKGNGDEQDYIKARHYLQLAAEKAMVKRRENLTQWIRVISEAVREETEIIKANVGGNASIVQNG